MGGRLPLTMHGAWVGSWGIPQNPRSRLQGTRPDESYPFAWVGHRRKRRRPTSLSAPAPALLRAETSFAAKALASDARTCAVLQKSQRRA
jgi:hypothetical protein